MHSSWTLESKYPKVKCSRSGGITVTLRYYAKPFSNILNHLPETDVAYPADRIAKGDAAFADFILDGFTIEPGETNAIGYINLTYRSVDQKNLAIGPVKNREIRCTFSDDGLVKPIESHPNYRTNWNYALIARLGIERPADKDSWWADNKDKILADADVENFRWIKPGDQIPAGWYLAYDAQKPGEENYIISAPIVTQRQYFRSEKDVEEAAKLVGTHFVPDKTYGKPATLEHWLVPGGVTIEPEDGWYVLTVRCQYADKWDGDLYDA